jgi:hypothetical protein
MQPALRAFLFSLGLVFGAPAPATAQAPGGPGGFQPPPDILERFDQNQDGRLDDAERQAMREEMGRLFGDGPRGFGGPGGPGFGGPGFGGPPTSEDRELVQQFDADGDGRLDAAERARAREFLAQEEAAGRGPRRPGGGRRGGPPGMGGEEGPAPRPGARLTPADVQSHPDAPLYAPDVLRTLFLDFESPDWERELAAFKDTDVEVPARLTVDDRVYEGVGVRFRGASSFFMVGEGRKRSLNLSVDYTHEDQRLAGYRTLNLLNSNTDPTFLRTVLHHHIAREYLPAPKANHVRVVINGESWGVYVNAQQFNTDFTRDFFQTTKGARWKVPGRPNGRAGLGYLGDDPGPYRRLYSIRSKDAPQSWAALIRLCKTLHETPPDRLEAALRPLLDVDGVLRFLALDNVFINSDGYWTRASDYNLYLDPQGVFHVIPHDVNETFAPAGGPGMGRGPRGGGPGGRGVELDPLAGADDPDKPLLNRLLAVPALKARYLAYVREIAGTWLDWEKLGPLARQHRAVIAADVQADTRKLYSTEAFRSRFDHDTGGDREMSLKTFAEKRRAFLLGHTAPKQAAK